MSILDTFYILFKTNADEAAEDVKGVGKAADGAEKNLTKLDTAASSIGRSFVNMARSLAAPLLALTSIGSATEIAVARAAGVLEIDKAASKLNSAVGKVDAFTRSVQGAGGTTDQAIDSLAKLAEKVNEAFSDAKSGARKDFKEWGLAFQDTKKQALGAVDAMLALAGNLEKVSRAEALARIKKLGIEDATTIDLLLKGRRAVEEYMKAEEEQGVVTEEQVRLAREYQRELGKTGNLLTSFSNKIMELALPAVSAMVRGLRGVISWMGSNQKLVEGFFVGVAAAVTVFFLPAMASAAAATIAATWPFLAIGAAIAAVGAAFALAYEDVQAFLSGQPSLLGELVKKYEWVAVAVEAIGKAWDALKVGVAAAAESIIAVASAMWGAYTKYLSALTSGAKTVIDAYVAIYGPVFEALSKLFNDLSSLYMAAFNEWIGLWKRVLSVVVDTWTEIGTTIVTLFDAAQERVIAGVNAIPAAFESIVASIKGIWGALMEWVADKINAITGVIDKITSMIPGSSKVTVDTGGLTSSAPAAPETPSLPGLPAGMPAPRMEGAAGLPAGMPAPPVTATVQQSMTRGKAVMSQAASYPAAAAAQAAIPVTVEKRTEVTVGSVTVNTQATDAKGVAAALRGELQKELRKTSAQFDDGVDR